MVFVLLSAVLMKIGFQEDVSANPDTISLITIVLNAQMVNSMISIKESAEFNAVLIKFMISILENVSALLDSILFLVLALNVPLLRHIIPILKYVLLSHALESMNSLAISQANAFANLNTSELEEFAPTVLQDIIMIAIQTNVSASLVIEK
jgi:hypothetical protein